MSCVFIGIGGTGAKALESFTHLCAMGLGPARVLPLMVDPDSANGNVGLTRALLKLYVDCRTKLELVQNQCALYSTELTFAQDKGDDVFHWSPKAGLNAETLTDYFSYSQLGNNPETVALHDLCDMLYTKSELDMDWGRGFRGHPAVGAPVMAHIRDVITTPPWQDVMRELRDACGNNQPARLFVVGSIFGATGASGFPTIARVIRNIATRENWTNRDKLFIGGALLLPYFRYQPVEGKETQAKPEDFAVNSAAALRFYAEDWKKEVDGYPLFDAVYLLGKPGLDDKGQPVSAEGGERQTNLPHLLEFYAACAAAEFLRSWALTGAGRRLRQHEIGHKDKDSVAWCDVPNSGIVRRAILTFTTLAFAYLGFYERLVNDVRLQTRRRLVPWYATKFNALELDPAATKTARETLALSLDKFLQWLRSIHRTTDLTVGFINRTALQLDKESVPKFTGLDDELFREIGYREPNSPDYNPTIEHGYDALWDELNEIACVTQAKTHLTGEATGKLLCFLHQACQVFCEKQYRSRIEGGKE